jgi:hypothetical protein
LLASAATLSAEGVDPQYAGPVAIFLDGADWPQYRPATRFVRTGNSIVVDYEYQTSPVVPAVAFSYAAVDVGELVPGDYTVQARLFDTDRLEVPALMVYGSFSVAPTPGWSAYVRPRTPEAFEPLAVVVHSAAYFDPASLRAALVGNTIRVDFTYASDAAVGGPIPPGFVEFASVAVAGLSPGSYDVAVYGSAISGGGPMLYFTDTVSVPANSAVFEYFHERLRHYFIAAGPDEVALLDGGGQGGWKRTGQRFSAWLRAADAPTDSRAACRFYAVGPNSHFFTADAAECAGLRDIEAAQRAAATAAGTTFLGWGYEGTGFYTVAPGGGQCPPGRSPIHRYYNNRAMQNDSNHRFSGEGLTQAQMASSWTDEGVQLCSAQ